MSSKTLSLIVAGALASCALSAQAPVKTRNPTPSDRAPGLAGTKVADLRYGENPHQLAALYRVAAR